MMWMRFSARTGPWAAEGRDRLLSAGTRKAGHGGHGHRARVTGWVWHGRLAPLPPQIR